MLAIGKLSKATGVKVPTIRYYEQIGLLPEPERSAANQRLYSKKTEDRLRFIRHSRELGFPLEAVRDLLAMADQPQNAGHHADEIAKRQLTEVKARIARLEALKAELERMLGACASGELGPCNVIEVLGDHSLCTHDHPHEGDVNRS